MEFSDYSLQEGSLSDGGANVVLNSTVTRGCITIDTMNDQTPEPTESLTVDLVFDDNNTDTVQANVTLSINQTVVVIVDQSVVVIEDQTGTFHLSMNLIAASLNNLACPCTLPWFV